jgi:hypothetical protein
MLPTTRNGGSPWHLSTKGRCIPAKILRMSDASSFKLSFTNDVLLSYPNFCVELCQMTAFLRILPTAIALRNLAAIRNAAPIKVGMIFLSPSTTSAFFSQSKETDTLLS